MILDSVLALLGIGAVAAVILAIASRLLKVEENPLVELVAECLPGANCGGCGFAGCEAYATAVVLNADVPASLCTVGGAETTIKVGEISGKAVEVGEPVVAYRRCSRPEGNVRKRYDYVGAGTCESASMLEGGPLMCAWACIGLGDCVRACPFDAMYLENGVVEVISSRCMSCGHCISVCPRNILQLIPRRARVASACATHDKLKAVSDVCEVGCINCSKCVKVCPAKAISIEDNRIEVDHNACLHYGAVCGEACVAACPRFILRRMGVARIPAASADEAANPDAADPEAVNLEKADLEAAKEAAAQIRQEPPASSKSAEPAAEEGKS